MRAEEGVGRRRFLTLTLAGGVSTVFALEDRVEAGATGVEQCQVTLADALLLFVDLLLDTQQQAIYIASEAPRNAAKRCADALTELHGKIGELMGEICQSPKSARAEQLRGLVETGRMNARLIQVSAGTADEKFAPLVGVLNKIGELIDQSAQEVKTECEFFLTERGKTLLREIAALVRLNKTIPGEIDKSQKIFAEKMNDIRCRVRKAEHSIFQVATAIIEGDADKLDAAVNYAVAQLIQLDPDAKDQPVGPSAAIRDLPAETPKKKDDPPGSAKPPETVAGQTSHVAGECDPDTPLPPLPGNRTEVLIGLLRGTQVLFKKRGAAPPIVRRDVEGTLQGVRFVPASIGRARGVPYEDIGTLLDKYCRPYTYIRRGLLTLAVDLAWTSYPEDKDQDKNAEHKKNRRIAIAYALSKMDCENGSDRNTLVTKLA